MAASTDPMCLTRARHEISFLACHYVAWAYEEKDMNNDSPAKEHVWGRKVLYGLPRAECRTYYPADLKVCPVCNCRERVPARPNACSERVQCARTF
jgi:hypothetical protein